jgi:hypothetical protein
VDPTCHPSPPTRLSLATPPPPPAAPRATQRHLGRRPSLYHPTITSPSLIPLLTSPSPSMALTPLTPPLLPRPPLSGAPLPSELFCALLHPCDELKLPPFVASGAPPLRHPSVVGEHLPSTASTGSFFPSIAGEHGRAPAPARRAPVRCRRTPCPRSIVDLRCPRSTAPWTRSIEFSVENLIRKSVIS